MKLLCRCLEANTHPAIQPRVKILTDIMQINPSVAMALSIAAGDRCDSKVAADEILTTSDETR